MRPNWRNICAVAGLIALFIWGPTILREAKWHSPFRMLPGFLNSSEPRALIVLGTIITAALVAMRKRGHQ